jgi:hypothetical protein
MFVPDAGAEFFQPGSRNRVKKAPDFGFGSATKNKYFLPKKLLLSSWKYDQGRSSRIRIFFLPGSKDQKSTGSQIPDIGSATLFSWIGGRKSSLPCGQGKSVASLLSVLKHKDDATGPDIHEVIQHSLADILLIGTLLLLRWTDGLSCQH